MMGDRSQLSRVSPSDLETATHRVTVAGIVLAAGSSSRFGDANKLLAEIDGTTVVERSIRPLHDAEIEPLYVVESEHDHVRAVIEPLCVRSVVNEASSNGQATSVRAGIEAVRQCESVDAVVISLGDMPFMNASTIEGLVEAYRAEVAGMVVAGYRGRRGNPVLFDAAYFDSLAELSGDSGARRLVLESDDAVLLETGDPGVVRDIDTPADLNRFDTR